MHKIDLTKLQLRSSPSRISSKHPSAGLWAAVAAAAAAAALLCLLLLASRRSSSAARFGIVIDAGSTGTRIHVFEYVAGKGMLPVIEAGSTAVMKVSPGISSYLNDPEAAGRSIEKLLEFGKTKVPKAQWGVTEVRLMATAGMRMMDGEDREGIMEACRRVLRLSGFRFHDVWATVISGAAEGVYAWVAANYAVGTLGGDPQETTGIIELGGASAQVAFVSGEPMPPEFLHVVRLGEATYNIYSNSFLHFGQNVAYESLHHLLNPGDLKYYAESSQQGKFKDPCTPKGYSHSIKPLDGYSGAPNLTSENHATSHAMGNFSECRSASLKLIDIEKDKCLYQQCHMGSNFIPKMQGRFLATENFFYTTKFFGLGPSPTLSDLILAGKNFCEEDWFDLKKKYYTMDEEILSRYCFSSAYITALLHDGLGFALNDKRIEFVNQVGGTQLEWALGAFIIQIGSSRGTDWITSLVPNDATTLLALFIISVLLAFSMWSVSRWRKPQLKTIYDLEKGHYIVTRVSR